MVHPYIIQVQSEVKALGKKTDEIGEFMVVQYRERKDRGEENFVRPMMKDAAEKYGISIDIAGQIFRDNMTRVYRYAYPNWHPEEAVRSLNDRIRASIFQHLPLAVKAGDAWVAGLNNEVAEDVRCSLPAVRKVTHEYKKAAAEAGLTTFEYLNQEQDRLDEEDEADFY